jgi:hypothetical protein
MDRWGVKGMKKITFSRPHYSLPSLMNSYWKAFLFWPDPSLFLFSIMNPASSFICFTLDAGLWSSHLIKNPLTFIHPHY